MADIIQLNESTWSIEDGHVRFYLLCGTKRAILIDSGMTTRNARDIAEGITDLPLSLINTHTDRDHTAGNGAFDEIYMSPKEEPQYKSQGGSGTIIPVKEGDEIDLGDRTLFIIDIPGHTPGSIAILDRKYRVLISGDSVQNSNIFMFGERRNLHDFINSMKHLKEYDGTYDEIYPMHGTLPEKPELVDKLLCGAQLILDGKVKGEPVSMFGNEVLLYRFDYAGFFCDKCPEESADPSGKR